MTDTTTLTLLLGVANILTIIGIAIQTARNTVLTKRLAAHDQLEKKITVLNINLKKIFESHNFIFMEEEDIF